MRARPTASSYQPLTGRRRSVRWPSYFQPLEHLLRYCARPPFALERLSVMRGEDGRIACVRSVAGHAACGDATADCCDSCDKPPSHNTSRIAWAKLMARVGEEFPVACPGCGGDIRLIAFITDPGPIRKVLAHLGEPPEPPPVSPARGPPTDWGELVQVHFRPGNLSGTDRRAARHRYP